MQAKCEVVKNQPFGNKATNMHNSASCRMAREKATYYPLSHTSLLARNSYHYINLASDTAVEILVAYI